MGSGFDKINLGSVSLGEVSLGEVSLGIIGTPSRRSGKRLSPLQAILAKMDAEMPGLRDSLVCWYHPKLQLAEDGMTPEEFNELLAETWPTCVGGLRDLSGNGRDMTIYGMDGYTSGMQEDGEMAFDGVDDIAEHANRMSFPNNQATLIMRLRLDNVGRFLDSDNGGNTTAVGFAPMWYRVFTSNALNFTLNPHTYYTYVFAPKSTYVLEDMIPRQATRGNLYTNIKLKLMGRSGQYAQGNFSKFIAFSRDLTDPEIEWVKDNIINF